MGEVAAPCLDLLLPILLPSPLEPLEVEDRVPGLYPRLWPNGRGSQEDIKGLAIWLALMALKGEDDDG